MSIHKFFIAFVFVLSIIAIAFFSTTSPASAITRIACYTWAGEVTNYTCAGSGNGADCNCSSHGWSSTPPEVTVSIESKPVDPALGESTNLVWSSTGATSCTASGDWSNSKALSGNQYVGPLNSFKTYTYTITCKNSKYSKSATANVVVDSYQAPESCSAIASLNPNKAKIEFFDFYSGKEGYAFYRGDSNKNYTYIGDITGPGTGPLSFTDYKIGAGWYTYKVIAHDIGCANCHASAPCETNAVMVPLPTSTLSLTPSSSSVTVTAGSSAQVTIAVSSSNLSTGVDIGVISNSTGTGTGVNSPVLKNGTTTSTLTITAIPGSHDGTITITGSGNSGAITDSKTISVTVTASPSGTLTASDCQIALNASSCDSLLTWMPKNLIVGKATSVTKNMPGVNTSVFYDASYDGSENLSRTNFASSISYGTTGFDLYHNNGPLAYDLAVATCAFGSWDGTKCSKIAKADGVCSSPASHYNCAFGTSKNNTPTLDSWTWDCEGSGGGITAHCREIKKPDLIAGSTTPATVTVGVPASFSSNITNSGTASTEISFPYFFQKASSVNGSGILSDLSFGATNPLASGATRTVSSSITFASTGVYSVRLCVDKTGSSSNGTIAESNESNNCGSWTNVTVTDAPVNGACSSPTTHYSCLKGKSVNNKSVPTSWTWDCEGTNGGNKVSCEEKKVMSGTMVANPASCLIQKGDSACSVNLSWNTVYPEGVTSVTSSYPSPNTVVATGNAGTVGGSGGSSVSIPYNSRTFYLYNNAKSLVPTSPNGTGLTVKSKCVSGTAWNSNSKKCLSDSAVTPTVTILVDPSSVAYGGSSNISWFSTDATSCTASGDWSGTKAISGAQPTGALTSNKTYSITCIGAGGKVSSLASATVTIQSELPTMSGTLNPSSSSCVIPSGNSSCEVSIDWSITNPEGTSAVTSSYPSFNTTVATGNSGSRSVSVPYNSRDFYLFNNAKSLVPTSPDGAGIVITADCVSGTSWNGNICATIPPPAPPSPTASISVSPSSIASGGAVTITWSSSNANSCTGTNFNTGGATSGSMTVNPTSNTTYGISCDNGLVQATNSTTVTITSGTGKKPIFKEN